MAEDYGACSFASCWVSAALFISHDMLVLTEPKIKSTLSPGMPVVVCGLAALSIDHPIMDPSFHIQLWMSPLQCPARCCS